MQLNDVIIKPILSEKATELKKLNKYCFRVNTKATKNDIKRVFLELFKVHVIKCNLSRVKGKSKRKRYAFGYTPSWKKAIITLRKEETIEQLKSI